MKKSYRIKKESDFKKILLERQSFANRNFIVYVSKNLDVPHFRVGLSVGKKVGNAVTRNYMKRVIRESVYQIREELNPEYDLVIIARPNSTSLAFEEVVKNLRHVLKLAKVL